MSEKQNQKSIISNTPTNLTLPNQTHSGSLDEVKMEAEESNDSSSIEKFLTMKTKNIYSCDECGISFNR